MKTQDLASALEALLHDHRTSGNASLLHAPSAEQLTHRLYYSIDWYEPFTGADSARAFNVASLLAPFYFSRFLNGGPREDMRRAVLLYHLVCLVAPQLVPDSVLEVFRNDGDQVADVPSESTLAGYTGQGVNLLKEAETTGDARLLDGAIEWCLLAANANPHQDVVWAESLITLGNVLTRRYEYTGDEADLDRAYGYTVQAAEVIPPDDPCRLKLLGGFGHIAIRMFQRSGDLDLLELAVNALREAAYGAPEDYEHRAALLTNLTAALNAWYERTGLADAAAEALETQTEAVRITPRDHPDLPGRLVNLAGGLLSQVGEESIGEDRYDRAVEHLRTALSLAPDGHPDRPGCLRLLSGTLRARFEQRGDAQDLVEATEMGRSALQAGGAPDYLRPQLLHNHARALTAYAEHFGEPGVLTEAVTALREAVLLLPDDHPERTDTLTALGLALRARAQARPQAEAEADAEGAGADLAEAVTVLREASAVVTAPAHSRALAAAGAGRAAAEALDFAGATASFGLALEQLELTAWRGLERPDRERLIAQFPNLVADAAACAVRAGKPGRALELVEQGRGILLAQALENRADHRALRADAPELADRLVEVLDELEQLSGSPSDAGSPAGVGERRQAHGRRVALARQREKLLEEIRALKGHDRFLLPPSSADLQEAAADGPVVLLTASSIGCFALLVTENGVRAVPLAVEIQQLADRAVGLLRAIDGDPSPWDARNAVVAGLAWLWNDVVKPVLEALGHHGPVAPGGAWPRLWWCPTGLFTLFPLHAAGIHRHADGGTDVVLERVVSSYTPTLRVLLHARERLAQSPAGTAARRLVVSLPSTPGQPDLPAAADEARALSRRFPDAKMLTGSAATVPAVMEALADCSWAHFACHGSQDLADPSRAALALYDGPLKLWDIAKLRLPHAELAFLSACETSRGGTVLADEAISFAAAVQLAGFRHVIGTLWSIEDDKAPVVARGVYEALAHEHALGPAGALHAAARSMRAERPLAVLHWAPYVHVGP